MSCCCCCCWCHRLNWGSWVRGCSQEKKKNQSGSVIFRAIQCQLNRRNSRSSLERPIESPIKMVIHILLYGHRFILSSGWSRESNRWSAVRLSVRQIKIDFFNYRALIWTVSCPFFSCCGFCLSCRPQLTKDQIDSPTITTDSPAVLSIINDAMLPFFFFFIADGCYGNAAKIMLQSSWTESERHIGYK